MPGSKTAALLAAVCAATAFAQEAVKCGAGSYASCTPWHKARTVDGRTPESLLHQGGLGTARPAAASLRAQVTSRT